MSLFSIYKLYFSRKRGFFRALTNLLGFTPGNIRLYEMAFRHKSVAVPIRHGAKNSNERLEFLGDAILGAVVAELLFKMYPYRDEGFLTEMRSKIVSRANLNQLGRKLGLNELIQYDAKMINFPNKSSSLIGDAFEALVGAVYLDRGYRHTQLFLLHQIIKPHVDIPLLEQTETNFKSRLIEWCQSLGKEVVFEPIENGEGESVRLFTIGAVIDGDVKGVGRDYNKKNAEKLAAEKACEELGVL